MIILNGSKFAETEDEFVSSLFERGGTCKGYAVRQKTRIKLLNHQRELIGVVNKFGCILHARPFNGAYNYSFMTIPEVGGYDSYMKSIEEPRSYGYYCFTDSHGDRVYTYV